MLATYPSLTAPPGAAQSSNHGEKVVTSAAALDTIACALGRYGQDPAATELLDTRALSVIPRLNPDGAEISLTTPYRTGGVRCRLVPLRRRPPATLSLDARAA